MQNLFITVTENGFIVNQDQETIHTTMGRQWVFETPLGLSKFILKWGDDVKNPPATNRTEK